MPSDSVSEAGRRVVAGVAGTMAAQTLRAQGYDGELTIVGDERHAPYHWPVAKKLLTGEVHRVGHRHGPAE